MSDLFPSFASRAPVSANPKVVVSRPSEDIYRGCRLPEKSRSRRSRPKAETRRSQDKRDSDYSSPWEDIDEPKPRKRATSRPPASRARSSFKSVFQNHFKGPSAPKLEPFRFVPSLSRPSGRTASIAHSRVSNTSSERRRARDRDARREARSRDREHTPGPLRRTARGQTGDFTERTERLLAMSPSTLSVVTGVTNTSGRSSGSGSTVTQESYRRRKHQRQRTLHSREKHYGADSVVTTTTNTSQPSTEAQAEPALGEQEIAEALSASSQSDASDGNSSDGPDTPSSRSTFPSPTTTRSHSVAGVRNKHEPQHGPIHGSVTASGVESIYEDGGTISRRRSRTSADDMHHRQRSASRSSHPSGPSADHVWQQEMAARQHFANAHAHNGHYDHDSRAGREIAAPMEHLYQSYQLAQQQTPWQTHAGVVDHATLSSQLPSGNPEGLARPQAPDAPDLSRRTIHGYEMLATELASVESPVRPLYRKFEFLHHRILLHLQDELCEMEEQLRTLDEIIAQSCAPGETLPPASRRAEAFHGADIHHQRTHLLGRIFIKTEQYQRAMAAYSGVQQNAQPASTDDLETYRRWMATHSPLHEPETRFLRNASDLIDPARHDRLVSTPTSASGPVAADPSALDMLTRHIVLVAGLPLALMLPLLLFAVVPSVAGRLLVTALVGLAAFLVAAASPRLREALPVREWTVCGAGYALLMGALAGCIP